MSFYRHYPRYVLRVLLYGVPEFPSYASRFVRCMSLIASCDSLVSHSIFQMLSSRLHAEVARGGRESTGHLSMRHS
jgi:hypothetical protein